MPFNSRTTFTIRDRKVLACDQYAQALADSGAILLELDFPDPQALVLKQVVEEIGQVDVHDHKGTQVWDVKYDQQADQETSARSLTTREFPMHTDGSFEEPPPKCVALYVLQQDTLGGGRSQLVDSREFLPQLSDRSRQVLQTTKFKLHVPQEFLKDKTFVTVPLLDAQSNFRYRKEIIALEDCSPEQMVAIQELELLLYDDRYIKSLFLKTGSILIIDNGRFFHARTQVKDKNRHLLRMRFQPKNRSLHAGNAR